VSAVGLRQSPGRLARIGTGAAGFLCIALLLAGCGGKEEMVGIAQIPPQEQHAVTRVRLAPGDVIDIKFFTAPELNESQTIRPDGRIALQLVGEVDVEGRSPQELSDELSRLFAPHLKKPDVTVIVRSFEGRRVFVGGEVKLPGMIPMPGQMTALEAIMYAGGFEPLTAALKNVVVIRYIGNQRYGAALDMHAAIKGKENAEVFYLEPRDIIYVPRTKIVRVAQWIDQHINQLVPMLGIQWTHRIDDDNAVTVDLTNNNRNLR